MILASLLGEHFVNVSYSVKAVLVNHYLNLYSVGTVRFVTGYCKILPQYSIFNFSEPCLCLCCPNNMADCFAGSDTEARYTLSVITDHSTYLWPVFMAHEYRP